MKLPPTEKLVEVSQQSFWIKVITATPVIMAVLSTLLAGLSSNEMSSSQYFRSIAAREKNTLWSLAAGIGALAVTYAGYVFLFT